MLYFKFGNRGDAPQTRSLNYGFDNGGAEGSGGGGAYGGDVRDGGGFAGGEGEDDVAVKHGVGGAYGHGEAIVGHLGDLVGLLLGERGVGGDDGEGGVAEGRGLYRGSRALQYIDAVQEAEAIGVSGAGDEVAGLGVYDTAKSVDCDEGPDDVIANPSARAAEAALHSTVGAEGLADGRARSCTHGALGRGRGVRGGASLVAVLGAGADGGVADGQVEEDGGGYYGDYTDAHGKADASLFEEGHHAIGGGEAVGAASAEDDGVGLLDEVKGSKKVGFTGAGSGAANVDAADRAVGAEDHGAARDGYRVGVVADLDAWYVGNRVVQQNPRNPTARVRYTCIFNPVRLYMDAGHWVYVWLGAVMLTAARGRLRGLL